MAIQIIINTLSKPHDPHLLPFPGPAWSSTGPTQLGLLDFDASCTLSKMARTNGAVWEQDYYVKNDKLMINLLIMFEHIFT